MQITRSGTGHAYLAISPARAAESAGASEAASEWAARAAEWAAKASEAWEQFDPCGLLEKLVEEKA